MQQYLLSQPWIRRSFWSDNVDNLTFMQLKILMTHLYCKKLSFKYSCISSNRKLKSDLISMHSWEIDFIITYSGLLGDTKCMNFV